ncbi:MAG TPA: hypothetical protein VGN72_18410 [Tepidisphaeraceae bacterium]|jgi:uncharacterized membrane protein YgcG|nr:hypothetical protein [Tepidisphaeraceae bacterium]
MVLPIRTRLSGALLVAALAPLSPVYAADSVRPTATAAPNATTARPAAPTLRQILNARIPMVRLENAPLTDAIDFIRDITQANVNVNWKALELAGISRDTAISTTLRNVPVKKALSVILSQAGPDNTLAFYNDGDVLQITTRELADAQQVTRMYFVDDILVDVPDFAGPRFNLSSKSGSSGGNGGGGGSGGGLIESGGNDDRQSVGRTKSERADALIKLVTQLIRPDVWEQAGGTARISYLRGHLVITAPRSVHEAIGGPIN